MALAIGAYNWSSSWESISVIMSFSLKKLQWLNRIDGPDLFCKMAGDKALVNHRNNIWVIFINKIYIFCESTD